MIPRLTQRRRIAKWGVAVLVTGLVAIQLVPVDRTNPPVEFEAPATSEVRSILRRACYDCHSNETVWPWYSRIAPISWLVASDVSEGRDELNLSTWNRYTTKQQVQKLKKIGEEVAEGEMPPWTYRPAHSEASLSANDVAALRTWSEAARGDR